MTYNCPQCGLPRTGNQAVGLAMPQCLCSWQFTPPTPPASKREWQGLTDEERNNLWREVVGWGDPSHDDEDLMKAIEAKLKQKNGYAEEKNT